MRTQARTGPAEPAPRAKRAPAAKPAPARSASAKAAPAQADAAGKGRTSGGQSAGISNRLPAPRGGRPDNLTRVKGIGTVNEKKLNEHGIFHFDQIAAWKKADVVAVETYLTFDGRIAREEWIKQARLLAKGKETEFSRRVDAGKVASSHSSAAPKAAPETAPKRTARPASGKRGEGK